MQAFNSAAIAETNHCGYLHPGDITHHIFSGNRHFDPRDILTIWEDAKGVAAWVLIGPRYKSYDAQVRPDLRGGDFERQVLAFADERTVELMRHHKIEGDKLLGDSFRCDTARFGGHIPYFLGAEVDLRLELAANQNFDASSEYR